MGDADTATRADRPDPSASHLVDRPEAYVRTCEILLGGGDDANICTWSGTVARVEKTLVAAFGCDGVLVAVASSSSRPTGSVHSYRVYSERSATSGVITSVDLDRPDTLLDAVHRSHEVKRFDDLQAEIADVDHGDRPPLVLMLMDRAARGVVLVPIGGAPHVEGADDVHAIVALYSLCGGHFRDEHLEFVRRLSPVIRAALRNAHFHTRFSGQVLDTMPSAVVVLDDGFHVVYANEQFCALQDLDPDEVLDQHVESVFSEGVMEQGGLRSALTRLSIVEGSGFLPEVRLGDPQHGRIVEVRVCKTREDATRYVLILQDITARVRELEQLRHIQALGQEMQRTLDLEALVPAILSCVTAGPGFGFNRATIFLIGDEADVLQETLQVGPISSAEAHEIWSDIPYKEIEEYFQGLREGLREQSGESPAVQLARRNMKIKLSPREVLDVAEWGPPFVANRVDENAPGVVNTLRTLSGAAEIVVIPLIARDELVGIISANNLITRAPVTDRLLQVLAAFATQAALAVSNAVAYSKLESAYDELSAARSKLLQHEKLAIIGQMAAHVAHEIRNPLVNIGGFARRIVKKSDDTEVRRRAEIIVRECDRLEMILSDVMDFGGPPASRVGPVPLHECLREVVELLADSAQEAGIDIRVDRAENTPDVDGDRQRLKQVVLNLALNAIEAMPDGGHLTFRINADEEHVTLEVQDTGIGIRPEDITHLFDPFFTTKRYGSGLGLAVTKTIVEEHHGHISAASQPGSGTTVTIRLPRHVCA